MLSFPKNNVSSSLYLGIDVRDQLLTIVALDLTKPMPFYWQTQIALDFHTNNANYPWDHQEFPLFLKNCLNKFNVQTKKVVLAVPYATIFFKTIHLDKSLNEEEISIAVKQQAAQYFQCSAAEIYADFQVSRLELSPQTELIPFLCVAAKQLDIEVRLKVFNSMAEFHLKIIEVDLFALQRVALFFLTRSRPFFLKDMVEEKDIENPAHTNKAHLKISADFKNAVDQNRVISQKIPPQNSDPLIILLQLDVSHLSFMVCNDKADHTPIYIRIHSIPITAPSKERQRDYLTASLRALQLFLDHNLLKKPSLILLSGLCSNENLALELTKYSGIQTQLLDVIQILSGKIDISNPTTFAIAAGLAMWGGI